MLNFEFVYSDFAAAFIKKKSNRSLLFKLRDYLYNQGYRVPSRVSAARRSRAS